MQGSITSGGSAIRSCEVRRNLLRLVQFAVLLEFKRNRILQVCTLRLVRFYRVLRG